MDYLFLIFFVHPIVPAMSKDRLPYGQGISNYPLLWVNAPRKGAGFIGNI